jgi:Domain of unknown function (DUF4143)
MIERDVRQLALIERRGDLRRLLTLLAGRSGGLLVPASLATQAGLPASTLRRYLDLLSAVFLIKELPAWSAGPTQRAIGTPKLAYVDTGIAAHLLGQDAARLNEPGGAAGPVLETLVLTELARQISWSDQRARLYHYRTKDKVESTPSWRRPTDAWSRSRSRPARPSTPTTWRACGIWPTGWATASPPASSSTPDNRRCPSVTACAPFR